MMSKIALYGLIITGLLACSDAYDEPGNPYDHQNPGGYDKVNDKDQELDPLNIQALHRDIFAPTCANSGCHDGTFEPDFRTVESSYLTLVNQPIIKNDELKPLTARVIPGNAEASMLLRRMELDLNGNSGIMPLSVDPESDWLDRKEEYIKRIRQWIDEGAKDQNGNPPEELNFPPQLQGMSAFINGNLLTRNGFYNPINVPASAQSLDLWFSISDDRTTLENLRDARVNFSSLINQFDSTKEQPLTLNTNYQSAVGFYRKEVEHQFHVRINPAAMGPEGSVFWVRVYLSDDEGNDYEIPNENALFESRKYFAIRLVP